MKSTAEMIAVMQAYLDGKEIQYRRVTCSPPSIWFDWDTNRIPDWSWGYHDYRVKPSTPDTIDWSHVHPDYNYMARDANGSCYLFKNRPEIKVATWLSGFAMRWRSVDTHASYKRGTTDWKDSLVIRPGYTES